MDFRDRYNSLIQFYAEKYGVDWTLLKRQIRAESDFDPNARSVSGAIGLCQFMPATFVEWSDKLQIHSPNPYNPEHSIRCQAGYMSWLMERFANHPDQIRMALASYNFGLDRVKNGAPWPKETVDYVARILQ